VSGRALIVFLASGIFAAGWLRAQEVREQPRAEAIAAFMEGRRLLAAGKDARPEFRRAEEQFREATNEWLPTPGMCTNMGNAAFLAGDLPYAILAFRAGLYLDRHDPVLQANLAYARAQVVYPPGARGRPAADPWPRWLPRWNTGTMLGTGLVAYSLAWIGALAWWRRRGPWLATVALVGFGLAAAAVYGWRLQLTQWRMDVEFPPIVIAEEYTPLRTGNGPSYPRHPDLPMLRRGMEARRLAVRGDWIQVQFASGETGWIPITDAWWLR